MKKYKLFQVGTISKNLSVGVASMLLLFLSAVATLVPAPSTSAATLPGTVTGFPRCDVGIAGERGKAFTVKDNVATVPFKVTGAKNCKVRVTISSFYAPTMDGRPWSAQILYKRETKVFTAGQYSMSVAVPPYGTTKTGCFYQVDLSYGTHNILPVLAYGHGALDSCNPQPKVDIVKTVSKDLVKVGEEYTYTIKVTNSGNVLLNNVFVHDQAPANVQFLTASLGTISNTGNWTYTIPSLAVGASASFTITAKVTAETSANIDNTACVNAPLVNPSESNKDDACSTVPVHVNTDRPGVAIEKSVSAPEVSVGEEFTYTLKVVNSGNIDLKNVVVNDVAPANVTLVKADLGTVTTDGTKWSYTLPLLKVGESKQFVLTAKVTAYVPDSLINKACVNAPEVNPTEPTKDDDCDEAPVKVKPPVYSCVQLTGEPTEGVANSYDFLVSMQYDNGVTFGGADVDYGDGQVEKDVEAADDTTIEFSHAYKDNKEYTVTATLKFMLGGKQIGTSVCKAQVKGKAIIPECRPDVPVGDARCNPCKYNPNMTADDPKCVAPELPNTGTGGIIALGALVIIGGAFLYKRILAQKARMATATGAHAPGAMTTHNGNAPEAPQSQVESDTPTQPQNPHK